MPRKAIGRGVCGGCLEIRKLYRNPRGPVAKCRLCLRRDHRKDRKGWKKAATAIRRAVRLADNFMKWKERGGSLDDVLPKGK